MNQPISYREFVECCKAEGIEPCDKRQFLQLQLMRNLPLAEEDNEPCIALAVLSYSLKKIKE